MAEEKKKSHPVRKLTVKNFSVIKEAELEFGNITVLIGPEASGKSLLCKLAYFFRFLIIEIASEFASEGRPWESFLEMLERQFRNRFPADAWGTGLFVLSFESEYLQVEISRTADGLAVPRFSQEFVELYQGVYRLVEEARSTQPIGQYPTSRRNFFWRLSHRANELLESGTFIPAGRSFFANLNTAFALFQFDNLDPHLRDFAANLDWTIWRQESLRANRQLSSFFDAAENLQGGRVVSIGERLIFESPDGRKVPLSIGSSGTQELVPLLMAIATRLSSLYAGQRSMRRSIKPVLFVEEPEAHIFPGTQYGLVKLFAWLSSETDWGFNWIISTHSPYVLSCFNNLIEAGQAARNNAELRGKIAAIIPEQYWINEGSFKAYSIHDGKLESILNESGFVEGNYLDQVSETISDEFDRLIKLEYDHVKAS